MVGLLVLHGLFKTSCVTALYILKPDLIWTGLDWAVCVKSEAFRMEEIETPTQTKQTNKEKFGGRRMRLEGARDPRFRCASLTSPVRKWL